jgi:DNA-binding NarL/FixJ family response regulator
MGLDMPAAGRKPAEADARSGRPFRSGNMRRVLITDDHPIMRGALSLSIVAAFGEVEIFESATFEELIEKLKILGSADLALLDLRMPGVSGFDCLLSLRTQFPETPVVIISAFEDRRLINEAIALGAAGFIPKSMPRHEIVAALLQIADGNVYVPNFHWQDDAVREPDVDQDVVQRLSALTIQQRKVLQLLGTGKLNKEIAFELDIAETTVKTHVSAILHKLNVYSRTQAVVLASRLHLNDFDDVARQ